MDALVDEYMWLIILLWIAAAVMALISLLGLVLDQGWIHRGVLYLWHTIKRSVTAARLHHHVRVYEREGARR